MEARTFKPYFIIIALMILTSLALAFTVDVDITGVAGVKFEEAPDGTEMMYLPEFVGSWRGEQYLYCQNIECQRGWSVEDIADRTICPSCGGRLDPMTQAEKEALPIDTEMVKKRYARTGEDGTEQVMFVNVVLSGRARDSIHRPQRCLVAAGATIQRSSKIDIPIEDGDDLTVMLIDNMMHIPISRTETRPLQRYFAYWFIGSGRVTESHYARMAYIAIDRVFFNVAHRWAYISVSGGPDADDSRDEFISTMGDFIAELHPYILDEA